jgi:hypothetical protein
MKSRQLLLITLLTCFMVPDPAKAQVPGTDPTALALVFDGKVTPLSNSLKLPRGHYTGLGGTLVIDGGKDRRCTLEIPKGCVIENLKLHVHQGAELIIAGSLLSNCQIYAESKAVVTIVNSGLVRCEFTGSGDSGKGPPSMKLENCAIAAGGFLRAVNALGLDLQDCAVMDIKSQSKSPKAAALGGASFANQARSPRIRYTTFRDCYLNPTLFYTVSHCTFEDCTTLATRGEAAPAGAVTLPIRWVRCVPEQAPTLGSGVALQTVDAPIPGGCSLDYTWDKATLTVAGTQLAATAASLASILPASGGAIASTPTSSNALKLKQTHMNGLVVVALDSGKHAGILRKMHLTALPGSGGLHFNQDVGEDMMKGLREVEKLMIIRHQALPGDVSMEIGFDDKYTAKDGASASVAIGLMMEAALTGKVWDPMFAVTGDLNSDGAVQPIGGVAAKVRGATKAACKIVALPIKNESAVADLLISDGPEPLVGIGIFSITQFDDAVLLANLERAPLLKQALIELETVRTVLQRNPQAMSVILKSPAAASRLQAILDKAPQCLSAKYLLLYAQGRAPATLTIVGSINAADVASESLLAALRSSAAGAVDNMRPDDLGGCLNQLRNLRPKADTRVWPYIDALINFGALIREAMRNPSIREGGRAAEFMGKVTQLGKAIDSAIETLNADPSVREDAMR